MRDKPSTRCATFEQDQTEKGLKGSAGHLGIGGVPFDIETASEPLVRHHDDHSLRRPGRERDEPRLAGLDDDSSHAELLS